LALVGVNHGRPKRESAAAEASLFAKAPADKLYTEYALAPKGRLKFM
jgi:hypothetical protein